MQNYDYGSINPEAEALLAAIRRNDALIAKGGAELGIPVQGGEDLGTSFSALVPQSIDSWWTTESFKNKDLVLTKLLQPKDVTSSRHEVVVVTDYGDNDINGFMPEGGVASVESAFIDRRYIDIKYLSVQRSLTRPALAAGILGNSTIVEKGALAAETQFGLNSLAGKYERALFNADSSIHSHEFDGIKRQIKVSGTPGVNVHDLRGAPLTLARIVSDVGGLSDAPTHAETDQILVNTKTWASLSAQAGDQNGRWSQNDGGSALYFNAGKLMVRMPNERSIQINTATMMDEPARPSGWNGTGTTGRGAGQVPAHDWRPTYIIGDDGGAGPDGIQVASDVTSMFTVADEGTYIYVIKPYYRKGSAVEFATSSVAAINVTAGDKVTIELLDLSYQSVDNSDDANPLIFYKVYRTDRNGALSTAKFLKRVAPNTDGAAGGTLITDDNVKIAGMGDAYGLQTDEGAMYEARLQGTVRFPLAQSALRVPMAVARFAVPHVVHRKRQLLYENVSPNP